MDQKPQETINELWKEMRVHSKLYARAPRYVRPEVHKSFLIPGQEAEEDSGVHLDVGGKNIFNIFVLEYATLTVPDGIRYLKGAVSHELIHYLHSLNRYAWNLLFGALGKRVGEEKKLEVMAEIQESSACFGTLEYAGKEEFNGIAAIKPEWKPPKLALGAKERGATMETAKDPVTWGDFLSKNQLLTGEEETVYREVLELEGRVERTCKVVIGPALTVYSRPMDRLSKPRGLLP